MKDHHQDQKGNNGGEQEKRGDKMREVQNQGDHKQHQMGGSNDDQQGGGRGWRTASNES